MVVVVPIGKRLVKELPMPRKTSNTKPAAKSGPPTAIVGVFLTREPDKLREAMLAHPQCGFVSGDFVPYQNGEKGGSGWKYGEAGTAVATAPDGENAVFLQPQIMLRGSKGKELGFPQRVVVAKSETAEKADPKTSDFLARY
jgi:hypothetical protein